MATIFLTAFISIALGIALGFIIGRKMVITESSEMQSREDNQIEKITRLTNENRVLKDAINDLHDKLQVLAARKWDAESKVKDVSTELSKMKAEFVNTQNLLKAHRVKQIETHLNNKRTAAEVINNSKLNYGVANG